MSDDLKRIQRMEGKIQLACETKAAAVCLAELKQKIIDQLEQRIQELEAAFDLMRCCSLPPHDVSGQRMWEDALAVRMRNQDHDRNTSERP